MSTPAMTSRLDAVNTIISASGEAPVSSLVNSTDDAANADTLLDEVSRDVQMLGWHFNSENGVTLTPDGNGNITVPANVLKLDVPDESTVDVVQRGTRLYDRRGHTYVFQSPLQADIVYFLPFEELPEQARRYIAIRAARIFHDRYLGDEATHRFNEIDELTARASLMAANLENADINLFRSNPQIAWLRARR